MNSVTPALIVRDLEVRYARRGAADLIALRGVSFELSRGEFLAVVGASGSGKSTLARALAGLVPARGDVRLEVSGVGLRRPIQLVFQDAGSSLNPRRRIGAVLKEVIEANDAGRGAQRTPEEYLAAVGLAPVLADAVPGQLSGGQRQRAAIARALAADPSVLVCDEILAALDAPVQVQILELLQRLVAQRNLAVVFVTHDLAVARRCADRVAVLDQGAIAELGPPAQVFESPREACTRQLWAARLRWPDVDHNRP